MVVKMGILCCGCCVRAVLESCRDLDECWSIAIDLISDQTSGSFRTRAGPPCSASASALISRPPHSDTDTRPSKNLSVA
ncbi:uncharacterized protein ARMOST_03395 [Armillaria ostoyae]|uniref:Secreted protein n=1 Tax=Armillaria ostoyae TaxID=47428 RepID=A0A284QUJ1_ARMOS|nr:uncharacterized protein ARMOST_03395 [Armillaria ostoyae]